MEQLRSKQYHWSRPVWTQCGASNSENMDSADTGAAQLSSFLDLVHPPTCHHHCPTLCLSPTHYTYLPMAVWSPLMNGHSCMLPAVMGSPHTPVCCFCNSSKALYATRILILVANGTNTIGQLY